MTALTLLALAYVTIGAFLCGLAGSQNWSPVGVALVMLFWPFLVVMVIGEMIRDRVVK